MDAETCCACSGPAVGVVHDGAYRKPICEDHERLYEGRGYVVTRQ